MAERASPNPIMISLVAGMVGAGLALLFAPRSGRETRAKISERSAELKGQAEENLHQAKESFSTSLDKAKTSLTEALDTSTKKRTGAKQSPVLRAWEEEV